MIFRFTAPGRVTRRITNNLGIYTVLPVSEYPFPAQLVVPNTDEAAQDNRSPREVGAWRIRWRGGFQAPDGARPSAGERIMLKGQEYELIGDARVVDEGRTGLETCEVRCQPVMDLYPFVGELQEMDGTTVEEDVRFSVYSGSETHRDQGTYEDFDAEAPLDWQATLRKNRQLAFGGFTYRVVSAELNPVGKYMRMSLRRAGG